MEHELYARLLGQITVIEVVLCTLIEHAPSNVCDELREELQKIAARDRVGDGAYGSAMTSTAERFLDGGRLRRSAGELPRD